MELKEALDRGIAMCEGRKAVGDYVKFDEQSQPCFCILGTIYAGLTGKIPPQVLHNLDAPLVVSEVLRKNLPQEIYWWVLYENDFVFLNDKTDRSLRELADELVQSFIGYKTAKEESEF